MNRNEAVGGFDIMQFLVERLKQGDVQSRLDAISQFETVPAEDREQLFKIITEDFNHEVRRAGARMITLCPSMFPAFLSDPDPEVRIAIVNNSVDVRVLLSNPAIVLTRLSEILVRDPSVKVRCALARVLHLHAKVEGAEDASDLTTQTFVPLIEQLLKDLNDDVRVTASLNLKELTVQFGFNFLFDHLHRCMQYMLTDTQWRVRNSAVELLFGLALVSSRDFFNQHILDFLLKFLRDPCCNMRLYTLTALPNIAQHLGYEWLKTTLMESLQTMADSQNFLE
jgi:HEAT repeat protein